MNETSADLILDTALEFAETASWTSLHLYQIAERLDISLDQIRQFYPQKDDLVDAWFDRADSAVLKRNPSNEFLHLDQADRLHQVIMTWFEQLASHHRITCQMMAYKLEFGHLHLQVLGVMRVSRTVQWFREAARLETSGMRRIVGETVLTSIYLLSFAHWIGDDTPGQDKTRAFLLRHLKRAERLSQTVFFPEVRV